MHPAQAMTSDCKVPRDATLIGYIDKHPHDKVGLGYAVLFYPATGIEAAWDGHATRSLPPNWRNKSTLTLVSAAALLGRTGGMVTSDAKADAARANGSKGGRPRKAANE